MTGFNAALDGLAAARQTEGRALAAIFSDAADRMDALIAAARTSASAAPAAALERIRQRLETLGARAEDRSHAPRSRSRHRRHARRCAGRAWSASAAHALELRTLISKPEAAGRRLDFLSQELTREANTLCSKSADLELTRIGLDLKTVVDQIKEQAANVE